MKFNRDDIRIVKKPVTPEAELMEQQRLRQLAAAVRDEAHWAEVLRGAETDESRSELERVIGPMLAFRRRRQCSTPDCESGQEALYQPTLLCSSPFDAENPSYVSLALRFCPTCKDEATVKDFLRDSIWAQILTEWDPKTAPPVRARTMLQWERSH